MPAIAPSSSSHASAGVSPAASALAAPSSAPDGGASASPGDFNSQLDAALHPDPSPAPAAPAPPAATPPATKPAGGAAAADGKGDDDSEADGTGATGDKAPASPDPAAGMPNAVLESMAALLGSLAPPPPVVTPPPVAGAGSAFPTEKGESSAIPSPDAPAPLATPGVGTGVGAAPANTLSTALGAAAALPASTIALPLAKTTASENNAAPDSANGINLLSTPTVTPQAVAASDDKSGQKQQKDDSDDPDDNKSSSNDLLGGAFPSGSAVSGQLGTLFSETGGMPPVMEKNAALPAGDASTANAAASLGAALAAISPAKVGSTLSVASFLRGYPIASNSGNTHGAGNDGSGSGSAQAAPMASSMSLSSNAPSGSEADKAAVTLTSNSQFVDVIRQALDDRPMTTPSRIAVELQTPPGAMVTVFFSQANGQLRAQLSASDSGSLHWLQQQVGTLRDGGGSAGSVVWLPPQLDKQPGGEGESSPRQQQQQPQQQQKPPSAEDMALAESIFGGTQTGMEAVRN